MKLHMPRVQELLLQALETEIGGVQVYEAALECATHPGLRKEWDKYLDETKTHETVLRTLLGDLGIDPMKETPGRALVRAKGKALISTMAAARKSGDPAAAQVVAAECVVDAETKDLANWELIGAVAKAIDDPASRDALTKAHEEVAEEEDEHLYHTAGWARELWIQSLGMPAELPPAEEKKDVRTMVGAAKAKKARKPN